MTKPAGLTCQHSQGLPGHTSSPPFAATPLTPSIPKGSVLPCIPGQTDTISQLCCHSVCHQNRGGGAFTPQQVQFDDLGCSDPLWVIFQGIPWSCGPSFCLHISQCGVKLSLTRVMRRTTIPLELKDPIRHSQRCHLALIAHFGTFQCQKDLQEGWRGIFSEGMQGQDKGKWL